MDSQHHYLVLMNRQRIPSHHQLPLIHHANYQQPIITVRRIKPFTDALIQERDEIAYRRLQHTRAFINDKEYFLVIKDINEKKNYCRSCLPSNKLLCDQVSALLKDSDTKQYIGDIAGIIIE